jgi:GrpB protein
MLWGAFRHGPTQYRVHVHLAPAGSPEVAAMRGFRNALRADPVVRRRYAALKRAIVEGSQVDVDACAHGRRSLTIRVGSVPGAVRRMVGHALLLVVRRLPKPAEAAAGSD